MHQQQQFGSCAVLKILQFHITGLYEVCFHVYPPGLDDLVAWIGFTSWVW